MFVRGKKLDRKRIKALSVLLLSVLMMSSLFNINIKAEEVETEVEQTAAETPEYLADHLLDESHVIFGNTTIKLSEALEFNFFKNSDAPEVVLMLYTDIDEHKNYTYTLAKDIEWKEINHSEDLEVVREDDVLMVKKIETENSETEVEITEETQNIEETETQSEEAAVTSENEEELIETVQEETVETKTAETEEVLPETYIEIKGTRTEEVNEFHIEGFGTFCKVFENMMGAFTLADPLTPVIPAVDVDKHLLGKQESPGLYTYVRFGTQTFPLPKRVENTADELNKNIEKLTEVPREVEVNLVWNVRANDYAAEGDITKDTAFHYELPVGIKWNWDDFPPEERIIRNTKNPVEVIGHFEVDTANNRITAYYTDNFLNRAKKTPNTSFTTFVNISGSVTEADWDDVGDQPYHFEGIGSFDPEKEEAKTRIKVSKALLTEDGKISDLEYLGNGKYKLHYQTKVTGTYITNDPNVEKKLVDLRITDTMPDGMLKARITTYAPSLKAYKKDGSEAPDRGIRCSIPSGNESDSFGCVVEYIEDGETLVLDYYLELDLNAKLPDDENGALSDMVRRFENDVEVTAIDPKKEDEPLTDSSFTIDSYTNANPKKEGKRDIDNGKPDEVIWTIDYNNGKFAKHSEAVGGINIGGTFIKDEMGEEQDIVSGTFKFMTSIDGISWTEWTVNESGGRPSNISNGTDTIDVSWTDTTEDGILNQFSFYLPDPFYDMIRIEYSTKSTNPYTLVRLSNTASIASDAEGKDEKSDDGSAPGVGPGTVPSVEKEGDELGPNGCFEWTSDLTVHEGFSRNVRYYDAMEKGLELLDSQYPIEVYRVKMNGEEEVLEELDPSEWKLVKGEPKYDHIKNKINPDDEPNIPWVNYADLEDEKYSYNWYIEFTGDPDTNILPADGYEFVDGVAQDTKAVYRIKYYTNAPLPEKDPITGEYKTRKFYNEGQIRTKIDDGSDDIDRYNSSDAELEKKYIEKASNDSQYENVTGEAVDSVHGYIGWYVRVYPLEAKSFVEIRDDFTYSTDKTSMKLVDGTVHVYVSENKNLPSAAEEIDAKYYTVSKSSTSGFTVRINNPKAAGIDKDKFIYVFYQTKVDPKINATAITYINTASLNRSGDTNYPTATARRTRTDVVLSKTSKRAGHYVTYTIEINKQKLNIDPRNGILSIEDSSGESIEYIEGTMKFFVYNEETKEFDEVTGQSPYEVVSSGQTLDIKIPDETYVKIEYEALVTKKDGDLTGDDASNKVVIKGSSGFSVINHLKGRVQRAKAGAFIDSDHPVIKIVKVDNKSNHLEGAEFKITAYRIEMPGGTLSEDIVYEGLITDQNGVFQLTYDDKKDIVTEYDVLYKIEETKAPEGYKLDSKPRYIIFTDKEDKYEGVEVFTFNGEEIAKEDVVIETARYLYHFEFENRKPEKPRIPNTGVE